MPEHQNPVGRHERPYRGILLFSICKARNIYADKNLLFLYRRPVSPLPVYSGRNNCSPQLFYLVTHPSQYPKRPISLLHYGYASLYHGSSGWILSFYTPCVVQMKTYGRITYLHTMNPIILQTLSKFTILSTVLHALVKTIHCQNIV